MLPVFLVCIIPSPLARTSLWLRAVNRLLVNRVSSCIRVAQPLLLGCIPAVGFLLGRVRVADKKRAIAPHRMHHDDKLARNRNARLVMAFGLCQLQSPCLGRIAPLEPSEHAYDVSYCATLKSGTRALLIRPFMSIGVPDCHSLAVSPYCHDYLNWAISTPSTFKKFLDIYKCTSGLKENKNETNVSVKSEKSPKLNIL